MGTSFSLSATNDAVLTWMWATNYWFERTAGPNGGVSGSTNGWYALGSNVSVTAEAAAYHHFTLWTGAVVSSVNPLPLTMDQAYWLRALFAANLATNGTPEWWLAQFGWTNAFDAAETNDADQDGLAAWQEWIAGTDPTNRSSVLAATNLSLDASVLVLQWPSVSNRIYGLDRATNLMLFEAIATNLAATPPLNVHTDQASGLDRAFYRIKVERP
jgi:hypothetical protein